VSDVSASFTLDVVPISDDVSTVVAEIVSPTTLPSGTLLFLTDDADCEKDSANPYQSSSVAFAPDANGMANVTFVWTSALITTAAYLRLCVTTDSILDLSIGLYVSDLEITPILVKPGSSSVKFTGGVSISHMDRFYFLSQDEICTSTTDLSLTPINLDVDFNYNFGNASNSVLRLCIVRAGVAFSYPHVHVRVAKVTLNSTVAVPTDSASESASLNVTYGEFLVPGNSLFMVVTDKYACTDTDAVYQPAEVTQADTDYFVFHGLDAASLEFSLCALIDDEAVDLGIKAYKPNFQLQVKSASAFQPVGTSELILSNPGKTFTSLDSLILVRTDKTCSAGTFSESASVSSSAAVIYNNVLSTQTFDLSLVNTSAEYRLCHQIKSSEVVLDYVYEKFSFGIEISPVTVKAGTNQVNIQSSNTALPVLTLGNLILFVDVNVACPTASSLYSSTSSVTNMSSSIYFSNSSFPYSVSMANIVPDTKLRMCVKAGADIVNYPHASVVVEIPTLSPTTAAPITSAPSSSAPTTAAPVTNAPTVATAAPTTPAPTTFAPTTVAPTTATTAPTTVSPTKVPTASPVTRSPSATGDTSGPTSTPTMSTASPTSAPRTTGVVCDSWFLISCNPKTKIEIISMEYLLTADVGCAKQRITPNAPDWNCPTVDASTSFGELCDGVATCSQETADMRQRAASLDNDAENTAGTAITCRRYWEYTYACVPDV